MKSRGRWLVVVMGQGCGRVGGQGVGERNTEGKSEMK